jgi:endonuclease V
MEKEDLTSNYEKQWMLEQLELKKKLITKDDFDFVLDSKDKPLTLIGGVDISFGKDDPDDAVASLVVLSYPELKVEFELYKKVRMQLPYITGFLAFREVDFLVDLVDTVRKDHPKFVPQLIMVDGSGIHHPRGFGLASHLGVLTGIPTIGIAKKLLAMDGINKPQIKELNESLEGGSYSLLKGESGVIHGAVISFFSHFRFTR